MRGCLRDAQVSAWGHGWVPAHQEGPLEKIEGPVGGEGVTECGLGTSAHVARLSRGLHGGIHGGGPWPRSAETSPLWWNGRAAFGMFLGANEAPGMSVSHGRSGLLGEGSGWCKTRFKTGFVGRMPVIGYCRTVPSAPRLAAGWRSGPGPCRRQVRLCPSLAHPCLPSPSTGCTPAGLLSHGWCQAQPLPVQTPEATRRDRP